MDNSSSLGTTLAQLSQTDLLAQLSHSAARQHSRSCTQPIEQALSDWAQRERARDRAMLMRVESRTPTGGAPENVQAWGETFGAPSDTR